MPLVPAEEAGHFQRTAPEFDCFSQRLFLKPDKCNLYGCAGMIYLGRSG